jgi:hypothetical protein
MRNMMNATSERQACRMRADQEELAHRIASAAAGRDGRTAAGSALPPLFEANRYLVDDHIVLLKE